MGEHMSEWSDSEVAQRVKRELDRTRNLSPFVAKHADEEMLRAMRDALQKAWIILDGLRSYRDDAELLAILRSSQMEDAREAVRRAAMISIDGGAL